MAYKIFISYSAEDSKMAEYIYNCLSRIVEFIPYKAEIYQEFGKDFRERLQRELSDSFSMVILLTENGKNSQWVNQEIGYALALQERTEWGRSNEPHIIPISKEKVQLNGFITKHSTDILILEKYTSWEYVIADLITQIRLQIPRGLQGTALHFRITCFGCVDRKGFDYEYREYLPSHQDIHTAILSGKYFLEYKCPKCGTPNSVDVRTFLPHKADQ